MDTDSTDQERRRRLLRGLGIDPDKATDEQFAAFARWWKDNVTDPNERLKFVLASYNAGSGHVEDAQRLAAKHGDDPKKWDDVAYWLLQLSESEAYTDPVVEFGFCRGLEPVTYVSLILDRFAHYRQFVVTRAAE